MHLKNIPVGRRGRITGYKKGEKEYRRRLLMLGATPGVARIRIEQVFEEAAHA